MKKINTLLFVLLFVSIALAQTPQKMSYQAVIRDVGQMLVTNQTVGMQISILQGSATGAAIYIETQQPTSNINGLVSMEIGAGTIIFGSFSTIDWSNGPYFIKTETDPTGGSTYSITGTSQLLSVPYAFYAENSGNSIPGPQGPAGTNGIDGANGVDGINGTNGIDGISINWLGSLASSPGSPSLNDGYYNTTLLQSFIWNGASWQIIAKDGATGLQGPAGADGALNAWSLTGNTGTNPSTNFIGTTDNQAIVIRTNNSAKIRITTKGQIETLNTGQSVFIGAGAGANDDLSNNQNSFIGYQSGYTNTTGGYNIGVGYYTLFSNTIGNFNTSIGYLSLKNNTSGNANTASGWNSLSQNTTGSNNTANGGSCLRWNTTGENNTANGYQSLYDNTIGSYNTAYGVNSLRFNLTGNNNTANGELSLRTNTTGNENTANGKNTLYSNTTGNSNTAIGINALYTNTIGNNNTANGKGSLYYSTGNNNIGIGYNAQVPSATADNQVRIGDANIIYAGIQVAWSITSDKRWKADILPSNLGLNFIKKLNPVFYTRTNDKNKKTEYGFIAQELEATLNNLGAKNTGIITIDDEGKYSVRYNDLISPMVKAIQEQQQLIEQQQVLIEKMQKEIDLLKK